MNKIGWIGMILEFIPLLAFVLLAILYPVGDPQGSKSPLIRILDLNGTYWIRNAIFVPPPLLIAGLAMSIILWRGFGNMVSRIGAVIGFVMLGVWMIIMVTPLLIHVN